MNKHTLLGAHISISGGFYKSVERAESIGSTTMQIFSKSNRSWFSKPIPEKESTLFKETLKKSSLSKIMVHTSYLINLAAQSDETRKKSLNSLSEEVSRCDQLGIEYLVLHPGSHVGQGEPEGIKKIASGLDEVLSQSKGKTMILLETAAGQGTNLGYTFEQIKQIYDLSKNKKLLGVCLDTCHIFSAGYDISSPEGYKKTVQIFDQVIGINLLKAIHLNDSKLEINSRKDRHEKIGKGHIPIETFKIIMNDPKFKNIPKILETPVVDPLNEYEEEIKLLKGLVI